jgi:hypothetical protein
MRARVPIKRGPWFTEGPYYKAAVYWCLQYPLWKKELSSLTDTSKGIRYDKDKVQTSGNFDSTAELAMRRVEIESKIHLLESTAKLVMPECPEYMIRGVTEDGVRVENLIAAGMPFCKNTYLLKRQQFYHLISKRI